MCVWGGETQAFFLPPLLPHFIPFFSSPVSNLLTSSRISSQGSTSVLCSVWEGAGLNKVKLLLSVSFLPAVTLAPQVDTGRDRSPRRSSCFPSPAAEIPGPAFVSTGAPGRVPLWLFQLVAFTDLKARRRWPSSLTCHIMQAREFCPAVAASSQVTGAFNSLIRDHNLQVF